MEPRRINVVAAVVMTALLVSCSGDKKDLQVNIGVAARIGDEKIMKDEVDEVFEQLTEKQKNDYKGKRGKADFVDKMIEEEIMFQEAMKMDLQEEPEIEKRLEMAKRNILITEYFSREIIGKIEVSDEEAKKYYDDHPEEFKTRAIINAQHMFTASRKKAEDWKRRLAEGESFDKIAAAESEDDLTAPDGGNLGYFNPGGYVKFIGRSSIWSDAVNKLEKSEISDIIEFEKGYSIVKIKGKRPESIMPFNDVRDRIVERIKSLQAKGVYEMQLSKLKEKHKPVNFLRDELVASMRTAEQLWEIIQMEDDPYERIQYYRDIVNHYPDHKFAPQALFMIGFVYGEELGDAKRAKQAFEEVIREYPDSEVVGSAQWMIENVDKPHPPFESFESMKEAMEERGQ